MKLRTILSLYPVLDGKGKKHLRGSRGGRTFVLRSDEAGTRFFLFEEVKVADPPKRPAATRKERKARDQANREALADLGIDATKDLVRDREFLP